MGVATMGGVLADMVCTKELEVGKAMVERGEVSLLVGVVELEEMGVNAVEVAEDNAVLNGMNSSSSSSNHASSSSSICRGSLLYLV